MIEINRNLSTSEDSDTENEDTININPKIRLGNVLRGHGN